MRGKPFIIEDSYIDLMKQLSRIEQALNACRRISEQLLATEATLGGLMNRASSALALHPQSAATEHSFGEQSRQRLLTLADLANELGVSHASLHRLRKSANFPKCIHVGARRVAFRREEIDLWLAGRGTRRDRS